MTATPIPTVQTQVQLPGQRRFRSGKVREIFDLGDRLLMVATDRISAFDCVLPNGIPRKGHVLNQLSAWWFNRTRSLIPNHLITADFETFDDDLLLFREQLVGRSMLVRKAQPIAIECVVRGYLIGSGWKEYTQQGSVCGLPLRKGYVKADRLDKPIFTPARKAETGHDENIPFEAVIAEIGVLLADRLRSISLLLYEEAARYALARGIIIADTKFEFGLLDDQVFLIDEALTPDSSRFWPADCYAAGRDPFSYDKQGVRDYLDRLDWDKRPPAPPLPPRVVARTSERYAQVYELLTEQSLHIG